MTAGLTGANTFTPNLHSPLIMASPFRNASHSSSRFINFSFFNISYRIVGIVWILFFVNQKALI
jgi:hypothetical protein